MIQRIICLLALVLVTASGTDAIAQSPAGGQFIRYGKPLRNIPPWTLPEYTPGGEALWVITADPFLWHLAYQYAEVTEAAMARLAELTAATRRDLEASLKEKPAADHEDLAKVLKALARVREPEAGPEAGSSGGGASRKVWTGTEARPWIRELRSLAWNPHWDRAPFLAGRLRPETCRAWVSFQKLVRHLWGDERIGFPGWILLASRERLGLPWDDHPLIDDRNRGLLPRVSDPLDFDGGNGIPPWAQLPVSGPESVFRSAGTMRRALRPLIRLGYADGSGGASLRRFLWRALHVTEDSDTSLGALIGEGLEPDAPAEAAGAEWTRLRVQSLLASVVWSRKATLDSLVGRGRYGMRGYATEKKPRHVLLYAIPPRTWKALKDTADHLARTAPLLEELDSAIDRIVDLYIPDFWLFFDGPSKRLERLEGLARRRAHVHGPLLVDLQADQTCREECASGIAHLSFPPLEPGQNELTTPLADPQNDALQKKLAEHSWLKTRYVLPALHAVEFRYRLHGRPIVGRGAFPVARLRQADGTVRTLEAVWGTD